MKKTYTTGTFFVMSILSATILAQTTNDSRILNKTSSEDRLTCIRWSWTGDVYNRKVICLEWREEKQNKKGKDK